MPRLTYPSTTLLLKSTLNTGDPLGLNGNRTYTDYANPASGYMDQCPDSGLYWAVKQANEPVTVFTDTLMGVVDKKKIVVYSREGILSLGSFKFEKWFVRPQEFLFLLDIVHSKLLMLDAIMKNTGNVPFSSLDIIAILEMLSDSIRFNPQTGLMVGDISAPGVSDGFPLSSTALAVTAYKDVDGAKFVFSDTYGRVCNATWFSNGL